MNDKDESQNERIIETNEEENNLLKAEELKGISVINASELSTKDKLSMSTTASPINLPQPHNNIRRRKHFDKKTFLSTSTHVAKNVAKTIFTRRRLPVIDWALNYNLTKFTGDCIAGLTTALTVIPQGIGYAPLAGLPLEYGLYASIVPGFIYSILGTCKETTIGPTAPNSLLSFNYAGSSIPHALTLGLVAGLVEIFAGLFNLGFLVNFISAPVISAFTSSVAIQVMTSQVKGLLGLQVPGRGFVKTWMAVFTNMNLIRPYDAALGFSTIGILLFLMKLKQFHWGEGSDPESFRAKFFQKLKWIISISRNCIVVIASTILCYYLAEHKGITDALILTGDVVSGLPAVQVPWKSRLPEFIHVNGSLVANPEFGTVYDPLEVVEDLGIGLILLPLVSILPTAATAQFYSAPGESVDISQEILAMGVGQTIGSFVGSMPITTSIGRSAVNAASGVCTPFGGILTGLIIIAACAFLTPYFAYIPTTSVAAVIIAAMIFTVEIEVLLPIWKSKKIDLIPYMVTLFFGVFSSVEIGMIVGTLTHLAILLYASNNPKVSVQKVKGETADYFLVEPDRALFFPSVDYIRSALSKKITSHKKKQKRVENEAENFNNKPDLESASFKEPEMPSDEPLPVIIDLNKVADIDFTAAVGVRALAKSMKKSGFNVYFAGASESVEDILQGSDPSLFISYGTVREAEMRICRS